MDRNSIIEEILRKVLVEISRLESKEDVLTNSKNCTSANEKTKYLDEDTKQILVLPPDENCCCLDSLGERSLLKDKIFIYDKSKKFIDTTEYKDVVVCSLSNMELSKLSAGLCDSSKLELVEKAIMTGASIHIVKEGIQLIAEGVNAPRTFLRGYRQKLDTIKSWGINIASLDEIIRTLDKKYGKASSNGNSKFGSNIINKRFVTQRDIEEVYLSGYDTAFISSGSRVTDVAKEYAEKYRIVLKVENQ